MHRARKMAHKAHGPVDVGAERIGALSCATTVECYQRAHRLLQASTRLAYTARGCWHKGLSSGATRTQTRPSFYPLDLALKKIRQPVRSSLSRALVPQAAVTECWPSDMPEPGYAGRRECRMKLELSLSSSTDARDIATRWLAIRGLPPCHTRCSTQTIGARSPCLGRLFDVALNTYNSLSGRGRPRSSSGARQLTASRLRSGRLTSG